MCSMCVGKFIYFGGMQCNVEVVLSKFCAEA